jgi:hypothetical protein
MATFWATRFDNLASYLIEDLAVVPTANLDCPRYVAGIDGSGK